MGNCVSWQDRVEKARSDAIDCQIEEDSKKFRKECKILLLGAGESGKSTIVKQMKIIYQDGFSQNELEGFRQTIYCNTLHSAQAIVRQMRNMNIEFLTPANKLSAERIIEYQVEETPGFVFSADIAQAIHEMWQDRIIPKVMDRSSEFYLMDSASYFFTEALRIGTPDYTPTENDVLRARAKTTSITATRFNLGQRSIHMFDMGGHRLERKKWIHCFESVTSIIFCTALSEYDQVLLEDQNRNRMVESLILFESVINSRWFSRTSIILFLNKIDIFKNKLLRIPIEKYFPEYTGGADINKAAKYILYKFMQANGACLPVYPHLSQATDATNIRLIFVAIQETILQNALKDSGIL